MARRGFAFLAVFLVVFASVPTRGETEDSDPAPLGVAAEKESAASDAKADVTVSWKGGQITFPDAGGKSTGLRVRCSGNVTIEAKGITAKATELDVTIKDQADAPKVSNVSLRCTGDVTIEWKGFTAKATDLQYHADKDQWTLSSTGHSSGCVFRAKNSDGTYALLVADVISLAPFGGKVECVGVKQYRASADPMEYALPGSPIYGPPNILSPSAAYPGPAPSTFVAPVSAIPAVPGTPDTRRALPPR